LNLRIVLRLRLVVVLMLMLNGWGREVAGWRTLLMAFSLIDRVSISLKGTKVEMNEW
jgi:hypothetical protein